MPIYPGEILDYDQVMHRLDKQMDWLAKLYVNTMHVIRMHDRYSYERIEMALHDTNLTHFIAFGIAGLSVVADSLSAIRYARVRPCRDESGLITDFEIEGDFPKFGNDDDQVDMIAVDLIKTFMRKLRRYPAIRIPCIPVYFDHHLQCNVRQIHRYYT